MGALGRAPFYFAMNSKAISIKTGWLLSLRLTTYVLITGIVLYGLVSLCF